MKVHCDWLKMSVAMRLQMTYTDHMDSPHRKSQSYWAT